MTATDPPNDWLIVILAEQRSGTTVVRRTLDASPGVHDHGEIFHGDYTQEPYSFFTFKRQRLQQGLDLLFPSPENQRRLWEEYLRFLRPSDEQQLALVDVKYNSWHHLNSVWYTTGSSPDLVQMVRTDRVCVLHLVRSNLFSQACSALIADARGVWQMEPGAEVSRDEPAFRLDPATILARMQRSAEQTGMFRRFFDGHGRLAEVAYEDLFDGPRLSPTLYAKLRQLTRRDLDFGTEVALTKVTPPLRNIVANVDEIRERFAGTRWEKYVDSALEPAGS